MQYNGYLHIWKWKHVVPLTQWMAEGFGSMMGVDEANIK